MVMDSYSLNYQVQEEFWAIAQKIGYEVKRYQELNEQLDDERRAKRILSAYRQKVAPNRDEEDLKLGVLKLKRK